MRSPKQIAAEIQKLGDLISEETAPCGGNLLFYNKIAKELAKLNTFSSWKLRYIVYTAESINNLKNK